MTRIGILRISYIYRRVFLPLSKNNPISSCITARVNPYKKEVPIFCKIPSNPRILITDIVAKKGYIKDLKEKVISSKRLKVRKVTTTEMPELAAGSPISPSKLFMGFYRFSKR